MFYSCLPASSASSHASPLRARARNGRRSATVDIHCHVMTPEAAALAKDAFDPTREAMLTFSSPATREVGRKQEETIRGKLTSVATRLKDMDKAGIDIQAISPSPSYYYWAERPRGSSTIALPRSWPRTPIASLAWERCRCRRPSWRSPSSSGW